MSIQSIILLLLLVVGAVGGWLWRQNIRHSTSEQNPRIPDVYTIANIRFNRHHYTEHNGIVQTFTLLDIHPRSGYFKIQVLPSGECLLDRDYPHVRGWTRQLSSSQRIESQGLLDELPLELRLVIN